MNTTSVCIVHLTFWGFMESQDYFTLLSNGKQVDGTEKEILHRENSVTFSQATRMGFESAQIQQRMTN